MGITTAESRTLVQRIGNLRRHKKSFLILPVQYIQDRQANKTLAETVQAKHINFNTAAATTSHNYTLIGSLAGRLATSSASQVPVEKREEYFKLFQKRQKIATKIKMFKQEGRTRRFHHVYYDCYYCCY